MQPTDLANILAHDEHFRSVSARVEEKDGYVFVSNADIALPETNCVFKARIVDENVPAFLAMVKKSGVSVLLDSGRRPADLGARLEDAGLVPQGRHYIAVLDPASMVEPPGASPRFTPVGPSELRTFTDLALQGEGGAGAKLLWSFRLRNLLFSAYLAETSDGTAAAFALFHCGGLARLLGPFPAGPRTEYLLACRLVAKAWERAQGKGAAGLYMLVKDTDQDLIKPLGFRVDEGFWVNMFVGGAP